MLNLSANINIMHKTTILVSKLILKDFHEITNLQVSSKSINKFFSYTINNSKQLFRKELSKARPDWIIKTNDDKDEEINTKDKYFFIVNPIDGIENYKNGIPHFSISLAILYNSEIIGATIYDPMQNEFFFSEKGKGAFLNGKRIRVSGNKNIEESVFSVNKSLIKESLNTEKSDENKKMIKIINRFYSLRHFGASSLDLAWVACGRINGFFASNTNIHEVSSGSLIIREAGGFISDFESNHNIFKNRKIIATNSYIHGKILMEFKKNN